MAVAQEKPGTNAIITLVLGILSFVGGTILTGIPAWILGRNELTAINAGRSPEGGRTMATIGMWLGIVATILSIVGIVFAVMMMGGLAALTVGAGPR